MPRKKHVAVVMDLNWPYKRHFETFAGIRDFAEKHADWTLDLGNFPHYEISRGARFDGIVGRIDKDCYLAARKASIPLVNLCGTFASPDAGTWPVTAAGYALGGAHAANYVLSGQPAIPDATITHAPASIATPPTASAITDGQTLASSTLSGGAGSVPGTFAFTAPATQPPAGTAPHGVTFTPTDTTNYLSASVDVSVTVHPALTAFETWATDPARGLTAGLNDDPADDPDHDGFANLMEFVLGGEPMISSQAIRPGLSLSGGHAVFSYHRSHLSKSAVIQVVEYGGSLTAWTPLNIPAESTATVTITPGATSDLIEVTLPPLGPGLFARLKASE